MTAPAVAMELLAAVQAEEAPSHPVVEEATVVAAVDTVVVATVAEEIAVVATVGAEIAAGIVEVAIGAAVAVTEVAVADVLPRRSTRLPVEFPFPMPRSKLSKMLARRLAERLSWR